MGRTDGHVTTKRNSGFLRNRQLDFITGRAGVAVVCPRDRSIEWSAGRRTELSGRGLLPEVCDLFVKADRAGKLAPNQRHIADQAIMKGLARTGIAGLIDEATGYQEVRDKHALQAMLDAFLRKELAAFLFDLEILLISNSCSCSIFISLSPSVLKSSTVLMCSPRASNALVTTLPFCEIEYCGNASPAKVPNPIKKGCSRRYDKPTAKMPSHILNGHLVFIAAPPTEWVVCSRRLPMSCAPIRWPSRQTTLYRAFLPE